MGVEESVADCADALSEAEQNHGRESKHHQTKKKTINPVWRRPKGTNLREGKCRGGMTPPPRMNTGQGVEFGKVVIIL